MKTDHGGNIWNAARQMGVDPFDILDFSSNLNDCQVEIPQGILGRRDLITPYPDIETARYLGPYSRYAGIPVDSILPGPGLTYLIYRFCQAHAGSTALIVEPSFSEYEGACQAAGMKIVRILSDPDMMQKIAAMDFNIIFLASPSNPVGDIIEPQVLDRIVLTAERKGALVFLDEAFADLASGYDRFFAVKLALQSDHLIVGRSLTKLIGLASFRMGFLIGRAMELSRIRNVMEPWTLGQDALEFMRQFNFSQFRDLPETIRRWRKELVDYMEANRFRVAGDPRANFISVRLPPEVEWEDLNGFLLRRRILVKFLLSSSHGGVLMRVAVKSPQKNAVLMASITEYLKGS